MNQVILHFNYILQELNSCGSFITHTLVSCSLRMYLVQVLVFMSFMEGQSWYWNWNFWNNVKLISSLSHFTIDGQSVGRSVGRSIGQSVSQLVGQSVLASSPFWDMWPYFHLYWDHCKFIRHGTSDLMRGRVCQFLVWSKLKWLTKGTSVAF
jgi:hypothetical protein